MHFRHIDAVHDEACEIHNPGWNGETVSELTEAMALSLHPVSAALLVFSAIAVWRGNLWIALATSLFWSIWIAHIFVDDMMDDPRRTATDLGCIGHSTLFIGLAFALCAAMTLYTAYIRLRRSHLRRQ
ncbi:hypothetical protein RA27_13630 [Ruegeria sp. ANG-R]|uniref:hypothetical protein n=1 Tax=Ruegeria sp. ANG-R TaxID=1577903 RepID=UPI00057CF6F0|nr:hypothetical protein [Ruegeria sp. ANG-R]KIC40789.1 hypothetical protein RA27_13630 [Ruegeria sp. ANG-R]